MTHRTDIEHACQHCGCAVEAGEAECRRYSHRPKWSAHPTEVRPQAVKIDEWAIVLIGLAAIALCGHFVLVLARAFGFLTGYKT